MRPLGLQGQGSKPKKRIGHTLVSTSPVVMADARSTFSQRLARENTDENGIAQGKSRRLSTTSVSKSVRGHHSCILIVIWGASVCVRVGRTSANDVVPRSLRFPRCQTCPRSFAARILSHVIIDVFVQYVDTLEMKRRSVLGKATSLNIQRTDGLKEQLANYDARLTALRDQLKSSMDVKLRGSATGAGVGGLSGLGALAGTSGDTIPAVSATLAKEDQRPKQTKDNDGNKNNNTNAKNSIVDRLVTATGQGCKEVLEGSLAANLSKGTKSGSTWKTRPFKQEQVKSSCTLKLLHKNSRNVTIRVTFAPGKSVPAALIFEHAPKATAEFKRVGMVALKKKSVTQTKHVFHLGNGAVVDRFLRVTCMGLIGDTKNRFHAVSYLLVSGEGVVPESGSLEDEEDGASVASESVVSDPHVSEGVYKGDEAEFRVSMECGDLEGTLAESGRKALGVRNVQNVHDSSTKPKNKKASAQGAQSSVSVWERLSNYKPGDKGVAGPQPKMRVSDVSEPLERTQPRSRPHSPPPASPSRSLLSRERVAFVDGVLDSFGLSGIEAAEAVKNVIFGNSSFVSSLAQEQVDDLVECLPTVEERKLFRSRDSVTGTNEAEYFMAELATIDNLAAKVETKWFLADFDARVSVVQDASNLISTACHEIQGCSKLHLAIRIILSECSETLQGAKLLDVTLLKELKRVTYNEQGSLLHFVAAKLSEAAGSMKVPNLARDLPSSAPATRVTLADVKAELNLLMDGIDEASLAWRADEPAADTIVRRLDTAQSKLSSTEAIVTETEADFLECAINSGLDPASVKSSEELFQALLDFSDDLNNAHLENKCIGFLTKSKTVEKEVLPSHPSRKQELKVNARRSTRSMAQPAATPPPAPGRDTSELVASPVVSVTGASIPTVGTYLDAQASPSPKSSARARQSSVTASPTPMASRVSVEQLMHSAKKTDPMSASMVSSAREDSAEVPRVVEVDDGDVSSVSEELSTPVRNLLRSSRALIDSFDLRNVSNVSPIKYVGSGGNDQNSIDETETARAHRGMDVEKGREETEPSPLGTEIGPVGDDDDHLCEMSSPRVDMMEPPNEECRSEKAETVEEIQPDEEVLNPRQEAESEPTTRSRKTPTPERVAASIDLNLASKLLSNAEKVKASRKSGSSALRKSSQRLSTPQSLRMSQMPVLGSRGRSSRQRRHDMRESKSSGLFDTPGPSGQLVNKSRARTTAQKEQRSPGATLTPEQTKAVQALGEVIRHSIPSFSSVEADKESGLRVEAKNLDLDKILSTIILNAGNTPTGPLARGVRGGNVSLFDGDDVKELRRNEQLQGGRPHRKALLEPIIPAPLGMGVSVSNTVSNGISPQTLARSLQSSMRASTSIPAYSGHTSGIEKRRSVKGSVQIPKGAAAAIANASFRESPANHIEGINQPHLRESKVSHDASKSYTKAVSKDYSKAPTWREDPVGRSEDGAINNKPIFMAGPSTSMQEMRDGLSAKPGLMPGDLDVDVIPTPNHGFTIQDDDDEACGLSPLGLPDHGYEDAMAKDRMENLWGMRWE